MPDEKSPNRNAGAQALESTGDLGPQVARADGDPDAHYEPDGDQVVRVVHQVEPGKVPTQGPTDFDRRGGAEDAAVRDLRATPSKTSVWEASPPPDDD